MRLNPTNTIDVWNNAKSGLSANSRRAGVCYEINLGKFLSINGVDVKETKDEVDKV